MGFGSLVIHANNGIEARLLTFEMRATKAEGKDQNMTATAMKPMTMKRRAIRSHHSMRKVDQTTS